MPGPTKKGKQQYMANSSTEKSKERESAVVNYTKLAAEAVDREWAAMTFPADGTAVLETVGDILHRSWLVYEVRT